eukprot:970512-Rhodomonas_salina.1
MVTAELHGAELARASCCSAIDAPTPHATAPAAARGFSASNERASERERAKEKGREERVKERRGAPATRARRSGPAGCTPGTVRAPPRTCELRVHSVCEVSAGQGVEGKGGGAGERGGGERRREEERGEEREEER